jgi:hypothetical protein
VACDEVLGVKVNKKIRELVAAKPPIKNTMLLYEIVMGFVKGLCSDDQQTQADEYKQKYEEWKELPGTPPFGTLMTFIHVMEKHIEERKRLVGKGWSLQDYDSIEHFLKRLLPPLAKAIRSELARGQYIGLKVEEYTWEMVTEVVKGMRTAKVDPNKDFQMERGKGALMALTHRGGEREYGELRDAQGGVFSMAHGEQVTAPIRPSGGQYPTQLLRAQVRQNWGARGQQSQQGANRSMGNGAFRAGGGSTQFQGGQRGAYKAFPCSCCGGNCKSAFACQIFDLKIKFEDARVEPGRLMERCVLRPEYATEKRVPLFVKDPRKRFWDRESFVRGATGQRLRTAQLKGRMQEDIYEPYEVMRKRHFGQERGQKRDASGAGVFAVHEGGEVEQELDGKVEVIQWEVEGVKEGDAVAVVDEQEGAEQAEQDKKAYSNPLDQGYTNPLDQFDIFGVIQEINTEDMTVDKRDTETLMATKENSPHQLALQYHCGTMIAKVAVDTGAYGCFMTLRRLEEIKKHNPGSLSNCIKFAPSDPHSSCLSATSHVLIKHGRVDHTVFTRDKVTKEPVLLTFTKAIITDCPLDELVGLQTLQAMESWMRMSMDREKQVLQITHPKNHEFELVRYSKEVTEGCMPMVEVGGDACMAIAVAAGKVAGVIEGNRDEVGSQNGLEEIRVAMGKVAMRETWPAIGQSPQVEVTEIRCVTTGGNHEISSQCF